MTKLQDTFWLWGQTAGSHHLVEGRNAFNLPGENNMTPAEGAEFFGIKNCCRVVMGNDPLPPFDKYSQELTDMEQVVWSIVGDAGSKRNDDSSDLAEVLRQAERFDNITGGVLDDFFKPDGTGRCTVEEIANIRDKLHGFAKRKLDLWMVWYDALLDNCSVKDYLKLCDVITMWTWKASNLSKLDDIIPSFVEKTPGKRHLAGCYMWDYGDCKPMPIEKMKYQLDRYYHWLKKGHIEGIVFCSNCIADIGLDTVELTKNWIVEVGQEEI